MKKRPKNKIRGDQPVGPLKSVADFLPPPEQLVPVDDMVKITISLDASSLAFFKSMATKIGAKYQRMMREVLRNYARHYAK